MGAQNEPQKRRHIRVPLQLGCDLEMGGEKILGRLIDLSMGGARFRLLSSVHSEHLQKGARAEIRFATAWGMVTGTCEIAWLSAGTPKEAGLKFSDMPTSARMILDKSKKAQEMASDIAVLHKALKVKKESEPSA